jgi:hypothetical protein
MRRLFLFLLCLLFVTSAAAQDAPTPKDIARERIAAAAASGATTLDLSGLGLIELPLMKTIMKPRGLVYNPCQTPKTV